MASEKTKRIAKLFVEARRSQGLTQAEVAERAGMHPNSYAKLERGLQDPTTESLTKIVKALGIDPSKVI